MAFADERRDSWMFQNKRALMRHYVLWFLALTLATVEPTRPLGEAGKGHGAADRILGRNHLPGTEAQADSERR